MNAVLLERDSDEYVYGAVTFREANSTAGIFDFTVHVSWHSSAFEAKYIHAMWAVEWLTPFT